MFPRAGSASRLANIIVRDGFEADVVRDKFSNKEFQKCLGTNTSRIVFPIHPSRNSVYVEHNSLFRKEDKQ